MKKQNVYSRIILLVLCVTVLMQSGFVMPVFASGINFYYSLDYNSSDKIRDDNDHYIIVPPEKVSEGPQETVTDADAGTAHTTDTTITNSFDEPFRILGYTFNGWMTLGDGGREVVFENTPGKTATTIDDSFFPSHDTINYLELYGNWEEFGSPLITSGSIEFGEKNADSEKLEDSPEWVLTNTETSNDENIGTIDHFDAEKNTDNHYEYSTYVYNNVDYVNLQFELYEPQATAKVYINDEEIATTWEPVYPEEKYGDGYAAYRLTTATVDDQQYTAFEEVPDVMVAKTIKTADMPLKALSESADNQIRIEVNLHKTPSTLYNYEIDNTRTYIFNVKRIQNEFRVEYGNTPYGRMSASNAISANFLVDWTYVARVYNKKAWNIFDDMYDNAVDKGSVPDESNHEYINYDLDKTAMVVYNGQKFVDRGVSNSNTGNPYGFVIIDKNGDPVAVDNTHTVTRTITVDTVQSLKYPWVTDETDKVVETRVLNGTEGENVVDILTRYRVKPGVYTIKYTYDDPDDDDPFGADLRTMVATKNLIVIPRQSSSTPHHYDLNMDNYINALDTLMYDVGVSDNTSVSENLYRYRALDVYPDGTNNGEVDDNDKQRVITNKNILEHYSQEYYSVAEDAYTMNPYTPSSADNSKTQLYMDFLGYTSAARTENGTPIDAHDDTDAVKAITDADSNTYLNNQTALSTDTDKYHAMDLELWPGNTVFLGYRFDNIEKLDTEADYTDLKEITLTINYDTRYMQPQAINASAVSNHIAEYNPALAEAYNITVSYDSVYTTDRSTAYKKWNNADYLDQVKTLKLEMYLKDGAHYDFKNGKDNFYFLKLPFRVINVPKEETPARCAISTQLGANTLNLAVGSVDNISKYNGYMWDSSNDTNHDVTAKLNNTLQYMGDFVPNFVPVDKIEARELKNATYGYAIAYPGFLQAAEVDENELPPGLHYDQASGLISGTPTKAQDDPYIFFLNGTKYSIKVNKAPLTVTADDKTKIYGEANPTLTYTYNGSDLRNGDRLTGGIPHDADGNNLEKVKPIPVCNADNTTVVQSGYEIGFNETGLFDNYELTYVSGGLDITPRTFTVKNITPIPAVSQSVFEGTDNPYTFGTKITAKSNDATALYSFTANSGEIVNDDIITISFTLTYPKPNPGTLDTANADIRITDIEKTENTVGRNYILSTEQQEPSYVLEQHNGIITPTTVEKIWSASSSNINYTYGTQLSLNGQLRLRYNNGSEYLVTVENAYEIGAVELYYYYKEGGTEHLVKISEDPHGRKIPVSYTGRAVVVSLNKNLQLTDEDYNAALRKTVTIGTLTVKPQTLYVKADDKVRYYGEGYNDIFTEGTLKNEQVVNRGKNKGYTYTIINGSDVAYDYGDKAYDYETSGTLLADFNYLVYTCKDDPSDNSEQDIAYNNAYEIDKGRETTVRDILVNTDAIRTSNQNYTILPYGENGKLTIRKRPLQITDITGGIPALTAKYYTDTVSPFVVPFNTDVTDETTGEITRPAESPALAVYDGAGAETNTMSVRTSGDLNSIYSDDKVRIKYYAKYETTPADLNDEAGQNSINEGNTAYRVDLLNVEMDNTYEKSENYEVSDISWTNPSITYKNGGRIYKKRIRDIEVIEPFKTIYTYGEPLDFSLSDQSGVPSAIKVTYDSDFEQTITFKEALENYNFKAYYYRDGAECTTGITGHPEWLQHADTGVNVVIKYEGPTLDGYQSNGWTYGETDEEKKVFTVHKHRLRVKSDDVFVTYGNDLDQYSDRGRYTYTYNQDDLQFGEKTNYEASVKNITKYTDPLVGHVAGYTPPEIIVYKDDNVTEADIRTQAGTYPINISSAAADNYYFDGCYTNGTLTVRQRPLVVSKITIPDLSQTDAFLSNLVKHLVIKAPNASTVPSIEGEGEAVQAEFAANYGLLYDDSIYISFDATYPSTTETGNVKVGISNAKIESVAGTSSRNYYLQNVNTPQNGTIIASKIASISLSEYYDVTNDTDKERIEGAYQQKEYAYGDTLDLSTMRFTVQYDNGSDPLNLTYSQLADHGITAWFENEAGTVSDRITDPVVTLDIDYYNGKKVVFKSPEALTDESAPKTQTTHNIKVNKKELHVTVSNLSYTYGQIPTEDMVSFAYTGFVAGDSMTDLENDGEYVKPTLECKVDGKNIFENRIPVNVNASGAVIPYTGVIKFKEGTGVSHNYTFVFDNTANLTVNKRDLRVTDILSGIPPLSAEDLYNALHNQAIDEYGNPLFDGNGDPIYDPLNEVLYDETAISEKDSSGSYTIRQAEITESSGADDLQGLMPGDRVSFKYQARYNTQTDNAEVEIVYFLLKSASEDPAAKNSNYNLRSYPYGTRGEIQETLITQVKINADPDKMSYTYGELFDLSGGSVSITYNDKHTDTRTFDDLEAAHIELHFVDKNDNDRDLGVVKQNTLLTVSDYNGIYIKLIPDPDYVALNANGNKMVTVLYSKDSLTVAPHVMHVKTKNAEITYGDSPAYSWQGDDGWYYDTNDIVHGDSLTLPSSRFMTDMTPPSGVHALAAEGSSAVITIDETTTRGSYPITVYGATTPGEKQNYYFVYEGAVLTVNPKTITIDSINCSAPVLGADAVFLNGGEAPISVTGGKAIYSPENTSDITFSGNDKVINDDTIAISYSVEYTDTDLSPRENVTVAVYDVKFDDTYENNNNSNYVLTAGKPQTMSTGEIKKKQITNIEINIDPTLEDDNETSIQYTYGDTLDFNRGFVTVTYDSGLVLNNIPYNRIEALTNNEVQIQYSDGTPARHYDYLYPLKHDGLTVDFIVQSEKEVTGTFSTKPLKVQKAVLTVTARDTTRYYGDPNPAFIYDYSGFVYFKEQDDIVGAYDTVNSLHFLEGHREPQIMSDAGIKSPVGGGDTYPIVLSGGSSANYRFEFVNANLTIEKRPLDVEAITAGIPTLTSKIIRENPDEIHRLDGTARTDLGQLKLGNFSAGDNIEITYKAVYTGTDPATNVTVGISDVAINNDYGEGSNYVLRSFPAASGNGTVLERQITGILPVLQPKLEYTYGETLDLSGGGVRIEYDDGSFVTETFDKLENYGITLNYTDNNGNLTTAKTGNKLTLPLHNGVKMHIIPPASLSYIPDSYTGAIKMNKKNLHLNINSISSVYGDAISKSQFSFKYGEDFVYDEKPEDLIRSGDLVLPEYVCTDGTGQDVSATSIVGNYIINMKDGSATNYNLVVIPAILQITKRPIAIKRITGGIPPLTADIIRANPGEIHKIKGVASETQLETEEGSIVNDDNVNVVYNAVYNKEVFDSAYDVGIEYISMDDSYGRSYNYSISPSSAVMVIGGGYIYDKEIVSIELTKQPKLEYTYGERLDLSDGMVHIEYDTGEKDDISLDKAWEYRIQLRYDGDREAHNEDRIDVPYNSGKRIVLNAVSTHEVESKSTDALKINPKVVNVNVNKAESIYGDDPLEQFTFEYGNDFAYGEDAGQLKESGALTDPVFVCVENDGTTAVSNTTPVGTYALKMQDAKADDYVFVYNDNTLTINRRVLKVTDITAGIPRLTADIIRANPNTVHKLEGTADNSQMTAENIVNNDNVRIKYYAIYDKEEEDDAYDVAIEYTSMDDSYARSANYSISGDSIQTIKGGGSISDKEITTVEITEQPKLTYTYGDKIDLGGGNIHVVYDTGYEENISFLDATDSSHRLSLTYDDENRTRVTEGETVTVPFHNGRKIIITADTVHEVEPAVTEEMKADKRVLEIESVNVDELEFNGTAKETTGTIHLINMLDGDDVTASAVFTFRDALAGENKAVDVTNITVDSPYSDNYTVSQSTYEATGTIAKAVLGAPVISTSDINVSKSNEITVTPPALTNEQTANGARYEYSSDGGNTWQESNVFTGLQGGQTYSISVRIAETANYAASDASEPVSVKTNTKSSGGGGSGGSGGNVKTTPKPTPAPTEQPSATDNPEATKKPTATPSSGGADKRYNEPYMSGYDGKIHPDDYMTRAEAATLMVILSGGIDGEYANVFPDVKDGTWYIDYIAAANAKGFVSGFENGLFYPEISVTREQFAYMIIKFMGIEPVEGEMPFSDIAPERWSAGSINAAYEAGIVAGYDDSDLFMPEEPIRRSEAVRMINVATERIPEKEIINSLECPFTDLPQTHWAYYEIMKASVKYELP